MLKLSRVDHHRNRALDLIDKHYAARIDAILGPMAALHLLKRIVPAGDLVADKDAILVRAAEQDAELAAVDKERRDLKASVRSATASDEIKALIAHL
ncbi:hypothetical protein [uncultured Nitratireductor sp.]|uniref:hypothetical protein n=1 Tax=uncultured Nitratireductor sp. TaxID=520953 RepID=UPI0025CEB9E3|nr:hypothetical protein [uncultured Nitratireductor sp.]